ncbi:MAG: zinc ribbon domain-containing protein [Sedimentisphaerales bacterium]|nr:zinc ribbon domain-containing protein [Sedimentisphaerales bacterium]
MPTYEYACEACGNEFERFQAITAGPLRKCPKCGKNKLRRLIGTGAGVIFKGSGFYETDYRSENYKKGAESEKKATEKPKDKADKKAEGKTKDSRPNSKAGSASTSKEEKKKTA